MYFAYGHNTDTAEFLKRVPGATLVGKAVLPDYVLKFNRFANVEKTKGRKVEGVVWHVPPRYENDLDFYEGLGVDYSKSAQRVYLKGKPVEVFVYEQMLRPHRPPPARYVEWLKKGYKEHGIPLKQLADALRSASRGRRCPKKATLRKACFRRG